MKLLIIIFLLENACGFCEFCVTSYCGVAPLYKCTLCDKNYISINGNCGSCWGFCSDCTDGKCEQCPIGYYGNLEACNSCGNHCNHCTSSDFCTECQDHYFIQTFDQLSYCQPCQTPCNTCQNLAYECTSCYSGYLLIPDNICFRCKPPCNTCVNQLYQCTSCLSNYYYLTGSQCLPCKKPCVQCASETQCLRCEDTYYVDDYGSCSRCQEPCYLCYSENYCLSCVNQLNYYLESYQCVTCNNFDSHCLTCNEAYQCSSCDDGYYIKVINNSQQTACAECAPQCKTCLGDRYECTECQNNQYSLPFCIGICLNGYYEKDGECLGCDNKCSTCIIDSNNCLTCSQNKVSPPTCGCDLGYFLNSNNECQSCLPECETCNDELSCTKCQSPKYLQNGNCISSCDIGFYQKYDDLSCVQCEIQFCKLCNTHGKCDECETNYLLYRNQCYYQQCQEGQYSLNNQDCLNCNKNCQNCVDFPDYCVECQTGSYLLQVDTQSICVVQCPLNYFRNDIRCIQCSSNCQSCSSSYTCTSCVIGLNLFNGICINQCPDFYYSIDQQCKQCPQNCITCFDQKCLTCTLQTILHQDKCLANCPDGFYYSNNACKPCNIICKTCVNSQDCLSCHSPLFLHNNTCLGNCLISQYRDYLDNKCKNCINGCEICQNDKFCYKCLPEYASFNNICVNECDEGYYIEAQYCRECHIYCKTCQGPTEFDCLTCKDNLLRYKSFCIQNCPLQTVLIDFQCKQCYETCETCYNDGQYNCLTCKQDYVLLNESCYSFCPLEYYKNQQNCLKCQNNCLICINNQSCIKCIDNYYYDNNNCINICPDGYYGYDGICEKCHYSCLTCNGRLQNNCLSCQQSLILYQNECLSGCLNNFYLNQLNQCQLCNQECQICNDNQSCIQCPYNSYLYDNTCIEICPDGYMHNYRLRKCDQCFQGCKTCFGLSQNQCLTCFDQYFYYGNACYDQCPQFTFQNQQTCISCMNNCEQCEQPAICQVCSQGYYLFNEKCFQNCQDGYYADIQTQQCTQCISNCKVCSNNYECTVCYNHYDNGNQDYFLYNSECVAQCPYYTNKINLAQCTPNCPIDFINYFTFECVTDYIPVHVIQNKVVFCQYDTNTYPDFYGNKCVKCNDNCQKCYGPFSSQCLACQVNSQQIDCIPSCPTLSNFSFENDQYVCRNCIFKCDSCSFQNSCMRCSEGYEQQFDGKLVCVNYCNTGLSALNNGNICQACNSNLGCLNCSDYNICTECQPPKVLYNDQCVSECPIDYYLSNRDNSCYPCKQSCSQCKDGLTCLFPNSQYDSSLIIQNGQVYKNCDDGYYLEGQICFKCLNTCLRCINNYQCTACNGNLYIMYNNQCISKCPNYTYFDQGQCFLCDQSCLTCFDNFESSCLSCFDQLNFLISYDQNDNEYYSYCKQECPINYIKDLNTNRCLYQNCDSSCLTCLSDQPYYCVSCNTDYVLEIILSQQGYLQYGYCKLECQSNYYLEDGKCYRCNRLCDQCVDKTTYCSVCSSLAYRLNNQQCVTQCPLGYLTNTIDRTCDQCGSLCSECILNGTDNLCLVQTIEFCPQYQYLDQNFCKPCHWSCLTCSGPDFNNCLSCGLVNLSSADQEYRYFYMNQCVLFCPQGSSRYGSQCISCYNNCETCDLTKSRDYCLSCTTGYYLSGSACVLNCGYGQFSNYYLQICQYCFTGCMTCFGPGVEQCLSCNSGYLISNQKCLPYCPYKYYFNLQSYECEYCDTLILGNSCVVECPPQYYQENNQCYECTNQCTSCVQGNYLFESTCVPQCPQGYFDENQICQKCDKQCLSCINQADNCISCANYTRDYPPKCECRIMYQQDSPNSVCTLCAQQCQSCYQYYNNCLKCKSDRIQNPPLCTCPLGTYDNGINCIKCNHECDDCLSQQQCLNCRGDRIGRNCLCRIGMYDDKISQNCQYCHHTCSTCTLDGCINCKGNRLINNNKQCTCPQGYYEDNESYTCPKCLFKCQTCQNNESNCLICKGDRVQAPFCQCEDGYFDDEVNLNCQICPKECITCNKSNCLLCKTNRFGSICDCPPGGIDRQNVGYMFCETCELGTPIIKLQNDLITLIIEFGKQVTFPIDQGCQSIYQLDQLGIDPNCYVDEQNRIIIILGINNKIEIGMNIQLLNNIQGLDCDEPFKEILQTIILPPQIIPQSDILIFGPPETTKCQEVTFYVAQYIFDGRNGFQMVKWSLISQVQSPTLDRLQGILKEANLFKYLSITIPSNVLQENIVYDFKYEFINYLGQIQSKVYSIKCVSSQLPIIQLQFEDLQPLVYYINNRITFKAIFKQQQTCNVQMNAEVYYQIIIKKESQIVKQSDYKFKSILENYVDIVIDSYSMLEEGYYQILVQASFGKVAATIKSLTFKMMKPGIFAKILGGNQIHSFGKSFNLLAIVKDLNKPFQQQQGFIYRWRCQNIEKDEDCLDIFGKQITFKESSIQIIPKLTLAPYFNYKFVVQAYQENQITEFFIIVSITDLDIEILNMDSPNIALNTDVLFNQELDFKINQYYPKITGSIIYDFIQIAQFKIYYKEFTLTLQNLIDQFREKITLKIQALDSNYFNPLITSVNIGIIQPPLNCQFSINTKIGIAYQTIFRFRVNNCIDPHYPLQYRFQYYFNKIDFETDQQDGSFKNSELLIDFSAKSYYDTILPASTQSHSILIATARNNLGAEFNMTQYLIIGINNQEIELKQKQMLLEYKVAQMKIFFNRNLEEESDISLRQIFSESLDLDDARRVCSLSILSIGVGSKYYEDLTIKEDILNQLITDYEIPFLTEATKMQIQKSIFRLIGSLTLTDLYKIKNYLNKIEEPIQMSTRQTLNLNNIVFLNQAGYRDYQLRKLNYYKILSSLVSLEMMVDSQIKIFYTQYDGNISLINNTIKQIMIQNNIKFLELIQQVKYGALLNYQINGNEIVYNGECFNLIINRVTKDHLMYYTNQIDLTVKKGQNVSQIQSDTVFNFSYINYKKNPFILDESFPQSNLLFTNIQSYEPILPNGSLLIPQQSLPIRFLMNKHRNRLLQQYQDLYLIDQEPNQINYQCTNKYFSKWESNLCSSQSIEIDINGNQIINCNCDNLGPTTVETILADLFQFEKFQKAFSVEALLALLNFPFHRSVIVYSLVIFTLLFIFSIPYGFKKDQMDKERQMPIHLIESEYIRKLFDDRQQELAEKCQNHERILSNKCSSNEENFQLKKEYKQKTQDDQQIQEVIIEPDIDPDEAIERILEIADDSDYYSGQDSDSESVDQVQENEVIDLQTKGNGTHNFQQQNQNNDQNSSPKIDVQQNENPSQNSQFQSDQIIMTENQQQLIAKKQQQPMTSSQNKQEIQSPSSSPINAIDEDQILEQHLQENSIQNSSQKFGSNKKLPLKSKKTHIFNDDEHEKGDDLTLEQKEAILQIWYLEKRRKQLLNEGFQLKFTIKNLFVFLSLFQSILSVISIFDKSMPRPIRFCLIYITIITTCYINIFFQVNLNPASTIAYSILSSILSILEIFILTYMMPNKWTIIRLIGWLAFLTLIAIFIYLILVSMALEADESQGDISRSNEWGINFIISFMTTHCITDPLQLILFFKIIQISFNREHSLLRKIFIWLCLKKHFNIFFDFLDY